jgi:hypothetical protein
MCIITGTKSTRARRGDQRRAPIRAVTENIHSNPLPTLHPACLLSERSNIRSKSDLDHRVTDCLGSWQARHPVNPIPHLTTLTG